jgi:hypothetical protein
MKFKIVLNKKGGWNNDGHKPHKNMHVVDGISYLVGGRPDTKIRKYPKHLLPAKKK